MSIYFRGRRDNEYIDCSFFVKDGPDYVHEPDYRIGEQVAIIFDVTDIQAKAINDLERDNVRASTGGIGKQYSVHIPFRVSDRRQALSWKEVGILRPLGVTIYLQAESGTWEDIFKWICLGEVPEWADVEV